MIIKMRYEVFDVNALRIGFAKIAAIVEIFLYNINNIWMSIATIIFFRSTESCSGSGLFIIFIIYRKPSYF